METADSEHDENSSFLSTIEAVSNRSNQRKTLKPNRKPRREVWWFDLGTNNHSLTSVGQCFEDRLNWSLLSSSNSLLRHIRSPKDDNFSRSLHQCPGYLREEIALTCDLSKSVIVSHTYPGPSERCSICHQLVQYLPTPNNSLSFPPTEGPLMFNHVNFSFGLKSDSVPATVSLTAAESVPPSTANAASAPLTPRVSHTFSLGGTCPGGGRCDGTGGTSACSSCPMFKNAIAIFAHMELENAAAANSALSAAANSPMADTVAPLAAVIDPDLTTAADMGSDVDTSVGGGGSGNNKKARVAVAALCCMNCGTSRSSRWRGVGKKIFCNPCGGHILLPNFLLSLFLSFVLFCFAFSFFFLRFGGGAGGLL